MSLTGEDDPGGQPDYAGLYQRLLQPESIAVVGASETGLGGMVIDNLVRDFQGQVYPVNPRRDTVRGLKAWESVTALPQAVDLAVVLVPARQVPPVVEHCASSGVGGVLILSSGFAEAGAAGQIYQDEVARISEAHGMPVIGPNCNGYFSAFSSTYPAFAIPPNGERPIPGPIAIVSQSGGFGSYILSRALEQSLRVGWFVATGNEVDVTVATTMRYLIERQEVEVLLVFCEALRDPEVFLETARRAVELGKVIVVVKPGDSEAAVRAAFSHTASVVGSQEVFESVCRQFGVVKVDSIEAMIDLATLLQTGKRMKGRRIGIITSSGGAGVLMSDAASNRGLEVPELPDSDQARLAPLIPAFGSVRNPVDHTAAMAGLPPENYSKLLNAVVDSEAVDAVLALVWQNYGSDMDSLRQTHISSGKPIVAVTTTPSPHLSKEGIPAYADPSRAVVAVAGLAEASTRPTPPPRTSQTDRERMRRAREILRLSVGHPFVLESTAKEVLALYGLPVCREVTVHDAQGAVEAAAALGTAVALKALSYQIPHKSDAGAVRLGLRPTDDVAVAYGELLDGLRQNHPAFEIEGVLVQEMVPAAIEIALGLNRDPTFGPTVALSLGGTLVELMGKPVLLRAPFRRADARQAVDDIAGGLIRHPSRGLNDQQVDTLTDAVIGLGQLAVELSEVIAADINPLRISGASIRAADALLVLSADGG